jgi:hypothetical protein
MKNTANIQEGDKVRITDYNAPNNKKGRVGTISFLYSNGAMVKLGEGHFTPVKYSHLKKIK